MSFITMLDNPGPLRLRNLAMRTSSKSSSEAVLFPLSSLAMFNFPFLTVSSGRDALPSIPSVLTTLVLIRSSVLAVSNENAVKFCDLSAEKFF